MRLDDELFSGSMRHEFENSLIYRRKRAAITNFGNQPLSKWTFPIRYFLDPKYSDGEKDIIRRAFNIWQAETCVEFVEETFKSSAHVDVRKSATTTECLSFIGKDKIETSPQILFLGSSCLNPIGLTLHEIGHLLGLWHEHQRSDRHNYLNVLLKNAVEKEQSNFIAVSEELVQVKFTPYDFSSIMHYKENAFSRKPTSLNTIETKNALFQRSLGQREQLSFFDTKMINLAYCSETCITQPKLQCSHEGYQNPKDCSTCSCPEGLSGKLCEKSSFQEDGCGSNIHLTDDSVQTIESPGFFSPKFYPENSKCTWNITTEPGYNVKLTFSDQFGIVCTKNHCQDYLEMRLNGDYGKPGPRFCCQSPQMKEVKSDLDSALLVFRSIKQGTQTSERRGFQISIQRVLDETCAGRCQNGGACTGEIDVPCNCKSGFGGKFCEENIDDCVPNPCKNKGICEDKINAYKCSCVNGYTGTTCEIEPIAPDACNPNPCKNEGSCLPFNQNQNFFCSCKQGYTGTTCEKEPACLSSPCKNNGTCLDIVGGQFICVCTTSYEGSRCEKKNPCSSGICNKGICIKDTREQRGYRCACEQGYRGIDCTIPDPCVSRPCGSRGACILTEGNNFRCDCYNGYSGEFCENTRGPCDNSPCGQNGQCRPMGSNYECVCINGYTGTNCQNSPCMSNPCSSTARCELDSSNSSGFKCVCSPGYSGDRCTIFESCPAGFCKNGGTCFRLADGSFSCRCPIGYYENDCSTPSMCVTSPCQNGGTCSGGVNYRVCYCTSGFSGNSCEKVASPCNPNPCQGNGTCISQNPHSYQCKCPPNRSGEHCENRKNYCDSSPCFKGNCNNMGSGYTCTCWDGYTGKNCDTPPTACIINPCKNGGTCRTSDILRADGQALYECDCSSGYSGRTCEIEENEGPSCESIKCLNSGVCVLMNEEPTCICKVGYGGEYCEERVEESECKSNPCQNNGICYVEGGVSKCDCPLGWGGDHCNIPCGACPVSGKVIIPGSLYKPCKAKKLENEEMASYSGHYGYGGFHKCWWNWWNKPKPKEDPKDFTCCEGSKLIKTSNGRFKCAVEGWGTWEKCPSCGNCQKVSRSKYAVRKCDRNYLRKYCNYRRNDSVAYLAVTSCQSKSCSNKPCNCAYYNYYCSKCKYGCRLNSSKTQCMPGNIADRWYK
ncbi:DgyrCDS4005 [Dimorphilus gyrociliatus]|uniref:Metalloendopeptidase n=1 Tax=Dimorphilus gyrociliatus TaxID=2664684 RepID=A0A7I8VH32_9ANNE|nr:DgyrCDS4005 [Dimorphilus gyrociliatus]